MTEITPYVIDYLVAQAQASPYLGAANPAVTIFDGPPPTSNQLVMSPSGLTQRLWIGADAVQVAAGQLSDAATAEQGFAFLDNARTRDDQVDIDCAAECGSGDSVMASARGAGGLDGSGAFAVMAAVEVMLRGGPNPSAAIAGPGDSTMGGLVQWSEVVAPISLKQVQRQSGAWAIVGFKVSAFVRLTS